MHDTRILQLQNELDRAVTKKQNDLKNDERWAELNSKLAEFIKKKSTTKLFYENL